MIVVKNRIEKRLRLAVRSEIEIVRAFFAPPTHVGAAPLWRDQIYFFERVLPDITYPKISGGVIEGKAERIAQAVQPDFLRRRCLRDEGIIRGHVERPVAIDFNAQHFPQAGCEVLGVSDSPVLVPPASAVT